MCLKGNLLKKINKSKYTLAITGPEFSFNDKFLKSYEEYFRKKQLRDIFHVKFFNEHPLKFYQIYIDILKTYAILSPTPLHYQLHELGIHIITESIDNLHNQAGSINPVELNGNLNYLFCPQCRYQIQSLIAFADINDFYDLKAKIFCPNCHTVLHPSIVLMGQPINNFNIALNSIYKADLLLVIGAALDTWPINNLLSRAVSENIEILKISKGYYEIIH